MRTMRAPKAPEVKTKRLTGGGHGAGANTVFVVVGSRTHRMPHKVGFTDYESAFEWAQEILAQEAVHGGLTVVEVLLYQEGDHPELVQVYVRRAVLDDGEPVEETKRRMQVNNFEDMAVKVKGAGGLLVSVSSTGGEVEVAGFDEDDVESAYRKALEDVSAH